MLLWAVAGALIMGTFAMAIGAEMKDFPGGPEALASSVAASTEAMRIMRWPAERLDTLGGYLTYHNVILLNLALAIYGAIQGVRAVRGAEDKRIAEELLATGLSRRAMVWNRALGFLVAALLICGAIAIGTGAGLQLAGSPDWSGAAITLLNSALVAVAGFAWGIAISQLVPSSRGASATAAAWLVALYVITNLDEELGSAAVLRWISPFYYANQSRAMVPGNGLDVAAAAALVAMSVALLWAAATSFDHRDYVASALVRHQASPSTGSRANLDAAQSHASTHARAVPTFMVSSVWTLALRRGAWGLLAWVGGTAALVATLAWAEPAVMDVWSGFDYLAALSGGDPSQGATQLYWTVTSEIVVPVIAAYVVVQASGWVADLAQGRVEVILAGPVSWTRLVVGRWVESLVGVAAIAGGAIATLFLGGLAVDAAPDGFGLLRLAVMYLLFGAALSAMASLLVAWLRGTVSVGALATVVIASYMLTLLVALFGWPDWINRLSIFWAFGHPYLQWPPASAFAALAIFTIGGMTLASAVAERSPKVS